MPARNDRFTAGTGFGLILIDSIWSLVHVVPRDRFMFQTTTCPLKNINWNSLLGKYLAWEGEGF